MRIKIKILPLFLLPLFVLVVLSPTVLAVSSTFLQKATEYYQRNCLRRNVSRSDAINCYLFDKVAELDQGLLATNDKVRDLESIVATQTAEIIDLNNKLENIPVQSSKSIMVLDAHNNELGILVDKGSEGNNTIFVPSINKFIDIQHWEVAKASLGFTTSDCTGTPYLTPKSDYVQSSKFGDYYTTSPTETPSERDITSILRWEPSSETVVCAETDFVSLSVPAVSITIPFSEPLVQPFQFKYQ